jgi:hypothetical protein
MIDCEVSAEAYTLRSADLEISFRHVGDRWQHSISIPRVGAAWSLLTSDEGTPGELVLPSPALQDLRLEKLSDEIYEFQLLGQAGKEIYSAAIRLDGATQSINFDLCARRRSIDAALCTASRYRLADAGDSLTLQALENRWLILRRGERALEMAPLSIPGHPDSQCQSFGEGPARRLATGHFGEMGSDAVHKGVSVRWQYRISFSHS